MYFVRTDVCESADVAYPEFGSLVIDFVCKPLSLADPINPFLVDVKQLVYANALPGCHRFSGHRILLVVRN